MAILSSVRDGGARKRSDIGKALSMRSTSVSDLVSTLLARDLLNENMIKTKGRGRPVGALRFNSQRFGAVFVSVVDRALVAKAVDLDCRVLTQRRVEPPRDALNDQMAHALRELILGMAHDFPAGIEIGAVVLSLAGLLDVPRSIWCVSSRWPRMRNLSVADALRDLPWPVQLVRNLDAELQGALLGASHPPDQNVLLLHWGQGIGAAYSSQGAVVNRDRGRFCEIGHWGLGNARDRPCTCGNTDCLETIAALWAIGDDLRREFPELPMDESGMTSELRGADLLRLPVMREALAEVLRLTAIYAACSFPTESSCRDHLSSILRSSGNSSTSLPTHPC